VFNATPILSLIAQNRARTLKSFDISKVQEQELLKLVKKTKDTVFGKAHNFSNINSAKDFQENVPSRNYDFLWQNFWKEKFPHLINASWPGEIPFFAVTSGTSTGTTKYIPITSEMIASNRRAGLDILIHHVLNKKNSKLLSGKSLIIGGSTEFVKVAENIYSGDLSGIAYKTLPLWAKPFAFPPKEIAMLSDWEKKIEGMAKVCLENNVTSISGVPSWMLIFLDSFSKYSPKYDGSIKSVFPNLELIIYGGVNFAPYHEQFKKRLSGLSVDLREVYPASEGFIAVADRGVGEGLRLIPDNGIFYEFIPVEELTKEKPTRHWVKNIELNQNYAIVLTTNSGLFSYTLGDTVKFIDRERLLITGRTSYSLSAFGEHLILEEIEAAVLHASHAQGVEVKEYSVGAIFPQKEGELGRHRFYIELEAGFSANKEKFIKDLDTVLCEKNEDYKAHRAEGFGLSMPEVVFLSQGKFSEWMKSRGKLGGQHKVPRIITDQNIFASLPQN